MSNYIDLKYLNILSGQLSQFKRKDNNLFNFRCPFCGDSERNKLKARGYVFLVEGAYLYKCHNCGISANVDKLLSHVNSQLHREYRTERFVDSGRKPVQRNKGKTGIKFTSRKYHTNTPLKTLKKISQLPFDHPAKQYVEKRQIPKEYHRKLFYASKFAKFVNSLVPNKLDEKYDEPRLIIPFFDEYENLIGFQGRAFGKSAVKYITIMLNEDATKVYGLEEVDKRKKVYVTEGPIDSMFLPNSLAMAGSDMKSLDIQDVVYIYDNEPRSKQILNKIEKNISAGHSVCIWPSFLQEKDINDMILAGMSVSEILKIINDNTFENLKAKVKLAEWRKV